MLAPDIEVFIVSNVISNSVTRRRARGRPTLIFSPGNPLQGVDIIREAESGKLFVLEANPGGNTWTFSKGKMRSRQATLQKALGVDQLTDQYAAFCIDVGARHQPADCGCAALLS